MNVAAYLGSRGFKVLCVDSDPQGNTTTGFGIKKKSVNSTTYDIIIGKKRIQEAALETEFENVSIVPATEDLAGCEIELADNDNRLNRLKMQLLTCKDSYDYIFIDCPPVEIVADASVIAKFADMTVFVIRAGLMEREMLPVVEGYYNDKKFQNMSMLLNGTTAAGSRYGYHRYGYHYGYAYGYGGGTYGGYTKND